METKVILITGASSGIGAAIATYLVHDGHIVVGTYFKNEERSRAIQDQVAIEKTYSFYKH